jgi:glutamine amidotransferase
MIIIINYGMGNLGSVQNMFKRIGVECKISSDLNEIMDAEKLILPGVGAFDAAIQQIDDGGFREVLTNKVLVNKTPILGICLGMQLLTEKSEEGVLKGLGWIPAETKKFDFGQNIERKIPHMGWNMVIHQHKSPLTENLPDDSRFYFVHSYFVKCRNESNVICTTSYGNDFHSIIGFENIYGAQFHPEKSHKFGMKILENFSKI